MMSKELIEKFVFNIEKYRFEEKFIEVINEQYDNIKDKCALDEFISGIFNYCKGNIASTIVTSVKRIRLELSYKDVLCCFNSLKNDELSMYYFTGFLAEELMIDPVAMIDQNPNLKSALGFVQKGLSVSSIQVSNTPYEEEDEEEKEMRLLIERLKSQGAPMYENKN